MRIRPIAPTLIALAVILGTLVAPAAAQGPEPGVRGDSTTIVNLYLPLVSKPSPHACATQPSLLAPANGAKLDTIAPHLRYDNGVVSGAQDVQVQISTDPTFATYGLGLQKPLPGLRDWQFPINLDPSTMYYWRPVFVCANNVVGPSTMYWSFTTAGPGGLLLPAPKLVAPISGTLTSGLDVHVQWIDVVDNAAWLVRWRPAGNQWWAFGNAPGLDPDVTLMDLAPSTTWEWWVSASNHYAIGESSPMWRFTTPPAEASGQASESAAGQRVMVR